MPRVLSPGVEILEEAAEDVWLAWFTEAIVLRKPRRGPIVSGFP
jgi:hypothetical protein